MTKTMPVSNSSIQTFKECRRRWWLGYYRGLRPRTQDFTGPLALGSRVHVALETHHRDGVPLLAEWDRLCEEDRLKMASALRSTDELDSEAELGRIMLEGYLQWSAETGLDSDLELISAEEVLTFPLFDGRVELRGKLDQRVLRRSDGTRFIRDWKPQPLSEPVATPSGWMSIGDLKPGDYVLGQGFVPTKVLEVFDRGYDDIYQITFNDGTTVRATADHPWVVERSGVSYLLETQQLLKKTTNERIKPIAVRTDTSDVDLPIHPYVMGVWLGDGSRATYVPSERRALKVPDDYIWRMRIGVGDKAIAFQVADLYECTVTTTEPTTKRYKSQFYGINPAIGVSLSKLGLMDKYSSQRWIPVEYLRSSYSQRLDLLRGLMDTDGHVGSHQFTTDYSSTSQQLAEDVAELVRSLGGWARVVKSKTGCGYTNADGTRTMTGSWCWRVVIQLDVNPFMHATKKYERWHDKSQAITRNRSLRRDKIVKSVQPAGREAVRCIRVEADDSLYITSGMTLTHNTTAGFADVSRLAHINEQFKTYQLLEMLKEGGTNTVAGSLIVMLRKVKRTAAARPPFYEQLEVRHNIFAIRNYWDRLHGVISDMLAVRDALDAGADPNVVAYPRPARECTWKCPFFAVCPLFDDGSAAEQAVETLYTTGDPFDYYPTNDDSATT